MSKSWRASREYRKWRVEVIRRDKVCQICGSRKNRNAHHLNHATYYKDQRYLVDNGITLCKSCHIMYHTSYKSSFRKKCTRKDFANFLELLLKLQSLLLFEGVFKEENVKIWHRRLENE